ncbi:MAG: DUF6492 family protein [Elainellaceae cyanobacterium]
MENLTFALITPSYAPDFQRCKLLCWSIKKFVCPLVKHYIIVDRQDFELFQELADSNTTILVKEKILPAWIKRIPLPTKKNLWLNFKGFSSGSWLIRGWLVQQIIKLAAAQYTSQDILLFIDSDVAFIDRFNVHEMVQARGEVRLFRVPDAAEVENKVSKKWKDTAKALLGLPQKEYYDNYVSQIVTWRRDNLIRLYQAIEVQTGRYWVEALSQIKDLSEYVLYGMFVSYVLQDISGHYDEHTMKLCHSYWSNKAMPDETLAAFFQEAVRSEHRAVMISAKSPTAVSILQFQQLVETARARAQAHQIS